MVEQINPKLLLSAVVYCSRDQRILFRSRPKPLMTWAAEWTDFQKMLPDFIKLPYCPECARKRGPHYASHHRDRNIKVTLVEYENEKKQYRPSELLQMIVEALC